MIISRTPFRISFFGGGTDYPVWYELNGGAVLSTTIDKYCYVSCRYLPPFFEHKHRIVYSKIENVKTIAQIQHPAARAILDYLKIIDGVEIHHDGDLPARTGLGSSSSFTVGLLNAIYALKAAMVTKRQLAEEAIHVERGLLKEHVGSQDQIAVAFGGLNKIVFHKSGMFDVEPIIVTADRLADLQDHMMLFYTGVSRFASKIAKKQIKQTLNKQNELLTMHSLVDEAKNILGSKCDLAEFGKMLHESWLLKRSLTDRISTAQIDEIYHEALEAGALGGKLLGAGGGGFMLFFVRPGIKDKVRKRLKGLLEVKFKFETAGTQIIFYNSNHKNETGGKQ